MYSKMSNTLDGFEELGIQMLVDPEYRLPMLNSLHSSEGDDKTNIA